MNNGVYNTPRTVLRIESNDHSEVIVDNSIQSREIGRASCRERVLSVV